MDLKIIKPKIDEQLKDWEIKSVGVIDRYRYLVTAVWDSPKPYIAKTGKHYKYTTKQLCIDLEDNTVWWSISLTGLLHPMCVGGTVADNKEAIFVSFSAHVYHLDYQKDKFGFEYILPKAGAKDIKFIGKHFYIADSGNRIFRRDAPEKWTLISEKPREYLKKIGDQGADAVAGFSEDELYFAGEEGTLWYYNGKKWTRINGMPKNMNFKYIECCDDGKVYAIDSHCEGVAVGRHDQFEFITMKPNDVASGSITYEATTFNGKIYVVRDGVYEFRGDHWVEVDDKEIPEMYGARSIGSNDGVMIIGTNYSIKLFNGKDTVTLYGEEKEEAKLITDAFFKHSTELLTTGHALLEELDKQRKD